MCAVRKIIEKKPAMPCVKSGYCYLVKLRWSNVIKGLGVLLKGRLAHPF